MSPPANLTRESVSRDKPLSLQRCCLFVAKRFDGIESGSANGRDHPTDQSDGAQNDDGDQQGHRVDHEADVTGLGVLGHSAVKREPADGKGHSISEDDAQNSADESNGECLGQKLEENMPAARSERFLDADLTGALGHGNKHDVHQADAADAQRERADEAEQNLQADGDELELVNLHHQIKDIQSATVGGIELVLLGHDVARRLLDAFIVVGFVIEPDRVEVVRVLEVAHGGERDVDDAIDIVVAGLLHPGGEHTDNLKADAIDANVLAQRVATGEKFFPGVGTDDGNPRALDLVLGIVETPLREGQSPDRESVGIFAVDAYGVRAGVILHRRILEAIGRDVGDLRDVSREQVDIVECEVERHSRLLAAGLHSGAAGNHNHELGSEVRHDVDEGHAKTVAVGKKNDHGGELRN